MKITLRGGRVITLDHQELVLVALRNDEYAVPGTVFTEKGIIIGWWEVEQAEEMARSIAKALSSARISHFALQWRRLLIWRVKDICLGQNVHRSCTVRF